jgi:hypothetical protein
MVVPTSLPEAGSNGPWPETNTNPAATTAWLKVGGDAGAALVLIIVLGIAFSESV